jgi:hypothetical protein
MILRLPFGPILVPDQSTLADKAWAISQHAV